MPRRRRLPPHSSLLANTALLWLPLALLLMVSVDSAHGGPFKPFDVIAAAELDISYGGFCGCGGSLQLGLIAATTESLDLRLVTFGVTSRTPGVATRPGADGGWLPVGANSPYSNVLLPGDVSSVYPIPDPGFSAGLLPGEQIEAPFPTPGAPFGTGLRTFFGVTTDFEGDVIFDVWIDWRQPGTLPPYSSIKYSITGHVHRTAVPPIPSSPGSALSRVTSTQRVSAAPVPEPTPLALTLVSLLVFLLVNGARRRARFGRGSSV
jgi:hypothetical protein